MTASPVLSRDADGRPIEFFVALHRGDRSRFEFQLQETQSRAALLHIDESGEVSPAGSTR